MARRVLSHESSTKSSAKQPVFSFKLRAAYNNIARLSAAEREKGVIATSAENHAQGVALSAKRLGLRAVIVMPKTTPEIKIDAVRNLDAEVVLAGDHYMVNIADNLRTGTPLLFRDGLCR